MTSSAVTRPDSDKHTCRFLRKHSQTRAHARTPRPRRALACAEGGCRLEGDSFFYHSLVGGWLVGWLEERKEREGERGREKDAWVAPGDK